jgi:type II secretory pathway component PulJ
MLPPSLIRDLMSKKDDEVSDRWVHMEQLQSRYTMPKGILEDDFHFEIVRRQMTRRIPQVTADMADEIRVAFQDYWPRTTEWSPVKIHPLAMKIVARAANRIFVGGELCKSDTWPQAVDALTMFT